jgi:NAD(P)-dependent dehydrogenase (short-subunit alcohol dehydrogenase family)
MDASGPLAHALVHRLLRRGYTVHAATYGRSQQDEAALRRAAGDGDRLKLFRADPFDYHSIADAVRGCSGLFCMFNAHDQAPADVSSIRLIPLPSFLLSFFRSSVSKLVSRILGDDRARRDQRIAGSASAAAIAYWLLDKSKHCR